MDISSALSVASQLDTVDLCFDEADMFEYDIVLRLPELSLVLSFHPFTQELHCISIDLAAVVASGGSGGQTQETVVGSCGPSATGMPERERDPQEYQSKTAARQRPTQGSSSQSPSRAVSVSPLPPTPHPSPFWGPSDAASSSSSCSGSGSGSSSAAAPRYSFEGRVFASPDASLLFSSLYALFGPTFPGELLPESGDIPGKEGGGTYVLKYPGLLLEFPLSAAELEPLLCYNNSASSSNKSGGSSALNSPLQREGGGSASARRLIVCPCGSTLDGGMSLEPPPRLLPIPPPVLLLPSVGVRIGDRTIEFGASPQSVFAELGPPDQVCLKDFDFLRLHAAPSGPGDSSRVGVGGGGGHGGRTPSPLHGGSSGGDTSRGSMPQQGARGRGRGAADDYFFNYFSRGFDLLFDGSTHELIKVVAHTNLPCHELFTKYTRCFFSLFLRVLNGTRKKRRSASGGASRTAAGGGIRGEGERARQRASSGGLTMCPPPASSSPTPSDADTGAAFSSAAATPFRPSSATVSDAPPVLPLIPATAAASGSKCDGQGSEEILNSSSKPMISPGGGGTDDCQNLTSSPSPSVAQDLVAGSATAPPPAECPEAPRGEEEQEHACPATPEKPSDEQMDSEAVPPVSEPLLSLDRGHGMSPSSGGHGTSPPAGTGKIGGSGGGDGKKKKKKKSSKDGQGGECAGEGNGEVSPSFSGGSLCASSVPSSHLFPPSSCSLPGGVDSSSCESVLGEGGESAGSPLFSETGGGAKDEATNLLALSESPQSEKKEEGKKEELGASCGSAEREGDKPTGGENDFLMHTEEGEGGGVGEDGEDEVILGGTAHAQGRTLVPPAVSSSSSASSETKKKEKDSSREEGEGEKENSPCRPTDEASPSPSLSLSQTPSVSPGSLKSRRERSGEGEERRFGLDDGDGEKAEQRETGGEREKGSNDMEGEGDGSPVVGAVPVISVSLSVAEEHTHDSSPKEAREGVAQKKGKEGEPTKPREPVSGSCFASPLSEEKGETSPKEDDEFWSSTSPSPLPSPSSLSLAYPKGAPAKAGQVKPNKKARQRERKRQQREEKQKAAAAHSSSSASSGLLRLLQQSASGAKQQQKEKQKEKEKDKSIAEGTEEGKASLGKIESSMHQSVPPSAASFTSSSPSPLPESETRSKESAPAPQQTSAESGKSSDAPKTEKPKTPTPPSVDTAAARQEERDRERESLGEEKADRQSHEAARGEGDSKAGAAVACLLSPFAFSDSNGWGADVLAQLPSLLDIDDAAEEGGAGDKGETSKGRDKEETELMHESAEGVEKEREQSAVEVTKDTNKEEAGEEGEKAKTDTESGGKTAETKQEKEKSSGPKMEKNEGEKDEEMTAETSKRKGSGEVDERAAEAPEGGVIEPSSNLASASASASGSTLPSSVDVLPGVCESGEGSSSPPPRPSPPSVKDGEVRGESKGGKQRQSSRSSSRRSRRDVRSFSSCTNRSGSGGREEEGKVCLEAVAQEKSEDGERRESETETFGGVVEDTAKGDGLASPAQPRSCETSKREDAQVTPVDLSRVFGEERDAAEQRAEKDSEGQNCEEENSYSSSSSVSNAAPVSSVAVSLLGASGLSSPERCHGSADSLSSSLSPSANESMRPFSSSLGGGTAGTAPAAGLKDAVAQAASAVAAALSLQTEDQWGQERVKERTGEGDRQTGEGGDRDRKGVSSLSPPPSVRSSPRLPPSLLPKPGEVGDMITGEERGGGDASSANGRKELNGVCVPGGAEEEEGEGDGASVGRQMQEGEGEGDHADCRGDFGDGDGRERVVGGFLEEKEGMVEREEEDEDEEEEGTDLGGVFEIKVDSRWSDIAEIIGEDEVGKPLVLHHGDHLNPFGATLLFALPGVVFEVLPNGFLASITVFHCSQTHPAFLVGGVDSALSEQVQTNTQTQADQQSKNPPGAPSELLQSCMKLGGVGGRRDASRGGGCAKQSAAYLKGGSGSTTSLGSSCPSPLPLDERGERERKENRPLNGKASGPSTSVMMPERSPPSSCVLPPLMPTHSHSHSPQPAAEGVSLPLQFSRAVTPTAAHACSGGMGQTGPCSSPSPSFPFPAPQGASGGASGGKRQRHPQWGSHRGRSAVYSPSTSPSVPSGMVHQQQQEQERKQ
uniref:Uncharacterized protein n=1 Tax=Chromera velia CCMP2878 TaxID=1169474 RepID=A0A0G4FZC1_9ALVE|eukprot:Cvel_19490.t1-p1 / transcript=Cvel_19490.t1 / gene=Cvel_19490 / organism=Chromera_velia_CCMP2878 / gene_product=UPF0183 protein C16orf70, putative / transcript_product=UPF0183 protein C16orf70, putative / location=Cvel_scaffold1684:23976-31610(-) / protein_length=2126 / sequence_SO=supercontig / SO=protein_coding / is_pseudo=false